MVSAVVLIEKSGQVAERMSHLTRLSEASTLVEVKHSDEGGNQSATAGVDLQRNSVVWMKRE